MNPALRHSAAHVFVESLEAPELHPDDAHHLFRVLRLHDGESITVSDGRGGWRECVGAGTGLLPIGPVQHEPAVSAITIATSIPKGERAEWMAQKLTEVGVARICLVHCARSVVKWDGDRAERQLGRLRRVVREAAMQSRRVWLPDVVAPVPFAQVIAVEGVAVADPSGVPLAADPVSGVPTTIVIGPEGGFSPEELDASPRVVRLGEQILRVETAAMVAVVLSGVLMNAA